MHARLYIWVVFCLFVCLFLIREKNLKQYSVSINWRPMKENLWPMHTMKCCVAFKNDKNLHLLTVVSQKAEHRNQKHRPCSQNVCIQSPAPPLMGCVMLANS